MTWTPRDVIVLLLVLGIIMHPVGVVVVLLWAGRPLSEVGASAVEQILVAMIAVIAGYVAGKNTSP